MLFAPLKVRKLHQGAVQRHEQTSGIKDQKHGPVAFFKKFFIALRTVLGRIPG
jgi:hypothetical protein